MAATWPSLIGPLSLIITWWLVWLVHDTWYRKTSSQTQNLMESVSPLCVPEIQHPALNPMLVSSSFGIISLQSTEFKRCCFRIIIHFRDSGPIQIVFSTTAWKQLWRGGPIQIVGSHMRESFLPGGEEGQEALQLCQQSTAHLVILTNASAENKGL